MSTFRSSAPTKPCCASLSEATYLPYPLGAVVALEIDDDSPSFNFNTGKSNFAVLAIDDGQAGYLLQTTTTMAGVFVSLSSVFVPTFSFWDSAWVNLGVLEPELYQNTGKHNDQRETTYYGVCDVPKQTKYVVVFTDQSKLEAARIRLLIADGFQSSRAIREIQKQYEKIPAAEYAKGTVRPFQTNSGWVRRDLGRRPTGQVRISLISANST